MYQFTTDDEVVYRAQQILASRAYIPPQAKNLLTRDAAELAAYVASELAGKDTERLHAYYFEPGGKLLKSVEVSKGTEKEVEGNVREVVRQGLLCNATYVVIAHNHPNGDRTPSEGDKNAALQTAAACEMVGIKMWAAWIVTGPTEDDVVAVPPPSITKRKDQDIPELLKEFLGVH